MNTNKERFLGLLREVLTAGGALAFGAFDGLPSIIGLIVSISSVIWAWLHHEGTQIIVTSLRKTLSMIPGVLLALGWVDPNTAGLLASFLAPLFAIVWSFLEKDGVVKVPKGSGVALFALSASLALLGACSPQSYIVNTKPYSEAIQSNPEKVVVAPEHVTEVGGFQANLGGTVVTDHGEFSIDNDGVDADVVIDIRSGK